jgi:8-oxo-dGTP pyrophosphatase MutT (NUDIX family)
VTGPELPELPDLPEGRVPLRIDAVAVGGVCDDWLARALEPPSPFLLRDGVLALAAPIESFAGRSAALADWAARTHARRPVHGWRDERMVIRDPADGRPLAAIERALLRPLGLVLRSVQACAYTLTAAGPLLWVARRAPGKPVDPNRLDALVAGGISGFDDAASTLERECAEEAGIPASIARRARPAGMLELCYPSVDDGFSTTHREHIALHDLELPAHFVPVPADGEHAEIVAMTPTEALASIETGSWTRDGAQATADLILRMGWMPGRAGRASRPG